VEEKLSENEQNLVNWATEMLGKTTEPITIGCKTIINLDKALKSHIYDAKKGKYNVKNAALNNIREIKEYFDART